MRSLALAFIVAAVVLGGVAAAISLALRGAEVGSVAVTGWSLTVENQPPRAIVVPAHLVVPPRPTTYVLQSRVAVPLALRDRPLLFVIPHFGGKARLRFDGVLQPTLSRYFTENDYRNTDALAWEVAPSPREEHDVVLEVEHRWTQSAWFDTTPRLMARAEGLRLLRVRRFVHLGGFACGLATLLTVGFTYFAMYFLDRRRAAHGWFALAMTTAAVLPAFELGLLQPLFGTAEQPVLATAVVVGALASVEFVKIEFELVAPRWPWFSLAIVAVLAALAFPGPFIATQVLGPISVGSVAAMLVLNCMGLSAAARRDPPPFNALTVLVAWLLLGGAFITDGLAWLGHAAIVDGLRVTGWGFALLVLLHSTTLTREHIFARRRAEALNVELGGRLALLEQRQQQIQTLNEELRRQIAERSRDLSQAVQHISATGVRAAVLAPGTLVGDRYRVLREIGSGGMGAVYEVVAEPEGGRFALKILRGAVDRAMVTRFAREAEIVSRIDDPNVVGIRDVGLSGGVLYFVMELVEGVPLSRCRDRAESPAWTRGLLLQVARGLSSIHGSGFVHRDLKPGNVLVLPSAELGAPWAKIADFGIATFGARDDEQSAGEDHDHTVTIPSAGPRLDALTQTGAMIGTPPYLAPELTRGTKYATAAADVFAFGVLAYELLVGKRPFVEPPPIAAKRGAFQRPPSLTTFTKGLPIDVLQLLDRCLRQLPEERPTAHELCASLDDAVDPQSPSRTRARID